MRVKYTLYTSQGRCSCFSEADLYTNLRYAARQGWRVLRVAKGVEV